MAEEFMKILAPIAVTLIGALVSWGLAEASRWIKSRTRNENALAALEDVSALVRTTVSEVGQTFQVAAADGKFTADEGKQMKSLAIEKVKAQIPPMVGKHALFAVNNLNDFIASRIEREVAKKKEV